MSQTFDTLIQQGIHASESDNTELALQRFLEAAQAKPGNGMPHFLAAGELAQTGRMEEAERSYATAVLLAPDMAVARYQLGLLQFATDRLALALTTWQPLLALAEDDFMRRFVQGFFAMAAEDVLQAQSQFRAGLALNTVNPPMNRDIERVLASLDDINANPAASAGNADVQAPVVAAADRTEGEVQADASAHVLLANYRPAGKPN
jgi:tetratricopeptide (TPR) repeat protein